MSGKLPKVIQKQVTLLNLYYLDDTLAEFEDGFTGKIVEDTDGFKFVPDDKEDEDESILDVVGKDKEDLYQKLSYNNLYSAEEVALTGTELL